MISRVLSLALVALAVGMVSPANAGIMTTGTFTFRVGATAPTSSYWSAGHGDIDIHEHEGDWEIHYHFHNEPGDAASGGGTPAFPGDPFQAEWEAGDLTMFISSTVTSGTTGTPAIQRTRATGSQWNFTGVTSGATFYVLPASEVAGLPFLGFSAEGKPFDVTFSLGAVTGGAISAWTEDAFGEPTAYWSSSTPGANVGFTVLAGDHQHMFIGFSQLGDYTAVINAVPEPSSLVMAGAAGFGLAALYLRRRRRS